MKFASLLIAPWLTLTAAATPIIAAGTGLSQFSQFYNFNVGPAEYTPLTNQYPGLSFLNLYQQNANSYPNFAVRSIGNRSGGVFSSISQIYFQNPVLAATFALATNPRTVSISSYLGGVLVETFTSPSDPTSTNNFFGFQNSLFDSIRIEVTDGPAEEILIDNLAVQVAPELSASQCLTPLLFCCLTLLCTTRKAGKSDLDG